MSTREPDRSPDGAAASPAVSTAPPAAGTTSPDVAPGHRWWSAIPRNLGRARTSTVVLGVLFLAVFALYLQVKPPTEGRAPVTTEDTVEQSVLPVPTETEPTETEPTDTEPTEIGPTEAEPAEAEPAETEPTAPTTTPPAPSTPRSPSPETGSDAPTAPETTAPAPTGDPGDPVG